MPSMKWHCHIVKRKDFENALLERRPCKTAVVLSKHYEVYTFRWQLCINQYMGGNGIVFIFAHMLKSWTRVAGVYLCRYKGIGSSCFEVCGTLELVRRICDFNMNDNVCRNQRNLHWTKCFLVIWLVFWIYAELKLLLNSTKCSSNIHPAILKLGHLKVLSSHPRASCILYRENCISGLVFCKIWLWYQMQFHFPHQT